MKFTDRVQELLDTFTENARQITAQKSALAADFQAENITAKIFAERTAELDALANESRLQTAAAIEAVRADYSKTVEAANLIDGSMLNDDAKILQMPVKLSQAQFDNLAEKHNDNPLMCQLLRDYAGKHPGEYRFSLPSPEQKIERFNSFCDTAQALTKSGGLDNLQGAFFQRGDYTPAECGEEIA